MAFQYVFFSYGLGSSALSDTHCMGGNGYQGISHSNSLQDESNSELYTARLGRKVSLS